MYACIYHMTKTDRSALKLKALSKKLKFAIASALN